MVNTVGHRETERALQLGYLYPVAEAHQVGLVDRLVPQDQVLTTTQGEMDKWLKIPGEQITIENVLCGSGTCYTAYIRVTDCDQVYPGVVFSKAIDLSCS